MVTHIHHEHNRSQQKEAEVNSRVSDSVENYVSNKTIFQITEKITQARNSRVLRL
jgi:hypothetical protein